MKRFFIEFTLCFCISCLVPFYSFGQAVGEAKVYRIQFAELRSKVKTLLGQVEQQGRSGISEREKLNTREEILALTKIIHSVGEAAGRANIDILKKGQNSNKTLLFIAMGCNALGIVLESLDNYIDTDDRAFLAFAKEQDELVRSIEKVL